MGFVCCGQGLPQLLQSLLSLEVVWVGEEATRAQANEHDIDKISMTQSLLLFKRRNCSRAPPLSIQARSLEERLLWAGGLSAVVPPGQGMPSSGSIQFVSFPCVAGEYLEPMLAKVLIFFLL